MVTDHNQKGQLTQRSRVLLAAVVPAIIVFVMWAVHLLDMAFGLELHHFGIQPREGFGLVGIIAAPFLHGSMEHLVNNSVPMLVLGWCLFYFYPQISWRVLGMSWLLTGLWVWISARTSYHIGASGVVYALVAFLFLSGVLRKHTKLMAISMMVVFVYGSLVWGVLPGIPRISWESHLWGGVAGIALAIYFRKHGPQPKRYDWEVEEEQDDSEGKEAEGMVAEGPEALSPQAPEYIYHFKPLPPKEQQP